MARVGPFEPAPFVAIGVSGGADSMALARLLVDWTAARGGRLVALTVDHGLRAESADEVRRVAGWMAGWGVEHHVLNWTGPKPAASLPEAAREARLALLEGWCVAAGCLHLALAHHREDQAETVLDRLLRGSGVDGLAAMAPLSHRRDVRLLRPVLEVPRERLRAVLEGHSHVDDPSNADPRFRRTRLRRALEREGSRIAGLAATAVAMGRAREALEAETTALLAEAARPDPRGWVILDPVPLRRAPVELGLRAMARVVRAVSGAAHPPRLAGLERLLTRLEVGAATLSGTRLARTRLGLVCCRETRAPPPPSPLGPGAMIQWDRRLRIRNMSDRAYEVEPLGRRRPEGAADLPAILRATLPALIDGEGLAAVPGLSWCRDGGIGPGLVRVDHAPIAPLSPLPRGGAWRPVEELVPGPPGII